VKRGKTPTFLVELPLATQPDQAKHLRAHLEAARCLYNALLGEAMKRLRLMRADSRWQEARRLPKAYKQQRNTLFSSLRKQYGFSEYALHDYAKTARCSWIADHIDSTMAQTLASRAYEAANRVCLGKAHKVRFKSRGRGLDSVEGKRNDTGLRFVLQTPEQGNAGHLIWGHSLIPALIDWDDPVIKHGLDHKIKYTRLVRRRATSERAAGADSEGHRYYVQLVVEGSSHQKQKNSVGTNTIGLDIGPSSLAIVPQQGPVQLQTFCEELRPNARKKRRLQRKMARQRRANNPQNYDTKGRVKKGRLTWKNSRKYLSTRRELANAERRLAAHRKSLHGKLVNDLMRLGNTIQIEKTSFRGWQKLFGKSVTRSAPGMFSTHLKRIVAKTGGTLSEVGTYHTKLSQYCHGCQTYTKKPLSQRWHSCPCGIGPVQRDLYSAFLLAFLKPADTTPSIAQQDWEGAEPRLLTAVECLKQRANEGQILPRSMGITRAGARQSKSLASLQQERSSHLLLDRKGRVEALDELQEPPVF
jgi:transposase